MIPDTDLSYIAGLFDGEGTVEYKRYWEKRKKRKYYCWRIVMAIAMSDESVIRWVHEVLGVGTVAVIDKSKAPTGKSYYKKQWRWRCSFRGAYYVAKIIWPYTQVKLHKIEQIIDHYEPRAQELGDNIVDLETERALRKFNWNVHGT